jgi:hypothetical protein
MRGPLILLAVAVFLGMGTALAATTRTDAPPASDAAGTTARVAALSPTAQPTPLAVPAPVPPAPPKVMTPSPDPGPVARPAVGAAPPSRALGRPFRGRLERGVEFPASGPDHLTWDGVNRTIPNPVWRRYGTDVLVRTVLDVLAAHRAANPGAPRVLVGDLSLPQGGVFDQRYGGLGHRSHQNGLDVDIYYPRRDRKALEARRPSQVDRKLSQDLVDRFLAVGAELVVVGEKVRLRGPEPTVIVLPHHDDHLHIRIPDPDGVGPRR